MKRLKIYFVAALACLMSSCLDSELYTNIVVDDFFKTESDAQAYLNGVYGGFRDRSARCYIPAGEYAYQMLNEVAGANLIFGPGSQKGEQLLMEKAEWGVDLYVSPSLWTDLYMGISRANIGVDNLKNQPMTPVIEQFIAETRVIRAWLYADLVYLYGDVPFITTSKFDLMSKPERTSQSEVINFCINEIKESADKLPDSYQAKDYGRLTKWGAKAKLCKIYLEAKMWKECADLADEIITKSPHKMVVDYKKLWGVENEKNSEFLFVIPSLPPRYQHSAYAAHFQPADYLNEDGTVIGWDYYRATWAFYDSFDAADLRRTDLLTSYNAKTKAGVVVKQVGRGVGEGPIPNKFPMDPAHVDWTEGTDIVLLRLPDIILARAEALNELNGSNQTSIDLINMVRERAFGNANHNLELANYSSKEALRAAILQERGWELFLEGYNRRDLIRQGVYVETMKGKGSKNVSESQLLLPIPQSELTMNPNLTQNPY